LDTGERGGKHELWKEKLLRKKKEAEEGRVHSLEDNPLKFHLDHGNQDKGMTN